MMDHNRQFTRRLLVQITEHKAAFVSVLADRAEDHPDLARHMLAALDDLKCTCDLDTIGLADPVIIQK